MDFDEDMRRIGIGSRTASMDVQIGAGGGWRSISMVEEGGWRGPWVPAVERHRVGSPETLVVAEEPRCEENKEAEKVAGLLEDLLQSERNKVRLRGGARFRFPIS